MKHLMKYPMADELPKPEKEMKKEDREREWNDRFAVAEERLPKSERARL